MIRRIQHINTYIRSYSSNIKVFAFFKRGLLGLLGSQTGCKIICHI